MGMFVFHVGAKRADKSYAQHGKNQCLNHADDQFVGIQCAHRGQRDGNRESLRDQERLLR